MRTRVESILNKISTNLKITIDLKTALWWIDETNQVCNIMFRGDDNANPNAVKLADILAQKLEYRDSTTIAGTAHTTKSKNVFEAAYSITLTGTQVAKLLGESCTAPSPAAFFQTLTGQKDLQPAVTAGQKPLK